MALDILVNIPLGAAIAIAAVFTIPETRGDGLLPGADVDGALLSAVGFGALIFAIIEDPDLGWWSPLGELSIFGWSWPTDFLVSAIPVAFTIALAALVLFVIWENHRKKVQRSALLDLELFSFSTFSWGNLTAAMVAVGEFTLIFVLPLYLINGLALNVMQAGLVLAAMAGGAFFSGAIALHIADKFGSAGTVLLGLGIEVAGALILVFIIQGDTPGWLIAIPLAVYGLGLGLASAQLTGTVLRDIPVVNSGQASATQSTVRQIGSAFGTAIGGATLSVVLALALPTTLNNVGMAGPATDQLAEATRQSAGTAITQLRGQGSASPFGDQTEVIVEALADGLADATRWSLMVAVVFLLLGLVGALFLQRAAR
ncbi:MFS transporter [Corynebacterium sp.]|uniref:MFS transporter n=1 Tax=Corynebacterium sp. TaxID=1720 RepID=UPI003461EF02